MLDEYCTEIAVRGPSNLTTQVSSRERAAALDALRDVVMAAEQYRVALASHFDLGQTEAVAVNHLSMGELGQSELAGRLGITTGATTALVDRLEAAGLAQRTAHPTDRRRTMISLTKKGREVVTMGTNSMSRIFDGFDNAVLAHTISALDDIARNMEAEARNLGWDRDSR